MKIQRWVQQSTVTFLVNVFLIFVLAFVLTCLVTINISPIPQDMAVGTLATQDIKADQNYEIVDEKATQTLREEAVRGGRPVYDLHETTLMDTLTRIHEAFDSARVFLTENSFLESRKKSLAEDLESQMKREFMERIGGGLSEDQYAFLRKKNFQRELEGALAYLIKQVMDNPVIHDKLELYSLVDKGFILRRVGGPDFLGSEETITDLKNLLDLKEARNAILDIQVPENFKAEGMFQKDFLKNLALMAQLFLKANVDYNGLETEARKQKAAANIKDIIIKLERGESIIHSGDRIEPWHLTVFGGIRRVRMASTWYVKFIGVFLFVNLILLIVYYYAAKYIKKFKPTRKDLVFIGLNLSFFVFLLRMGVFVASSIREGLPFTINPTTLYYSIPIAAGAMLVRFILNSETALIFSVILSLLCGIFLENSLEMTVYYLMSGVFAAHAIAHVDKRGTVLLCGAYTGMVNAVTILSLNLINVLSLSQTIIPSEVALNAVAGFFGGLFTSMLVLILTPVAETLFNYTTDIKLLELANLSHPLLKEMIVRAPGTYHHSQLVGILSEAAANAISANPLLARVACYYHDIGKMRKPQYFIENQRGDNPHDRLSPSMSALMIAAHVKDGIEMAAEHKLPKKIADIIPQHQGTKLIGYFYNKAKKQSDPVLSPVDEKDYRYSGPKPQTREAGIIMLADTVEAAVRALPEKTPGRMQDTVEKLVNQHFVDEQLDECDLTLRDLHLIAEAFVKILLGIYHQRVEYPEGALLAGDEKNNETASQQSSSTVSNVAPLFRKKGPKNTQNPGAS